MTTYFLADRVRETSVDTGTGPLALAGAVPGFRRFGDAVPDGAYFPYALAGISRSFEWESGIATIDNTGRLVRTPSASSTGGAAVAFSPGLKTVALSVGAGWYRAIEDALDARQPIGDYASATHGHAVADIVGLATALDAKQPISTSLADGGGIADDDKVTVERGGGWATCLGARIARVDGDGQLGVRTVPQAALHVRSSYDEVARFDSAGSPYVSLYSGAERHGYFYATTTSLLLVAEAGRALRLFANGIPYIEVATNGDLYPVIDASLSLGRPGQRWAQLYAASGTIATSDAAMKKHIGRVPDAWLDAWGEVQWQRFRFRRRRRWHIGLIAQRVHAAFAARGIDGFAIGLLCRDDTGEGRRWGLRYDECQAIEAAWQRREIARIGARLAAIEART